MRAGRCRLSSFSTQAVTCRPAAAKSPDSLRYGAGNSDWSWSRSLRYASVRVGSALGLVLEETDGEWGNLFAEPLAQTAVATESMIGGYRAPLASDFASTLRNARPSPSVEKHTRRGGHCYGSIRPHSLHDERRRACGFLASASSRKDWQCVTAVVTHHDKTNWAPSASHSAPPLRSDWRGKRWLCNLSHTVPPFCCEHLGNNFLALRVTLSGDPLPPCDFISALQTVEGYGARSRPLSRSFLLFACWSTRFVSETLHDCEATA